MNKWNGMKRSPLRRKTPLRRSTVPLQRTRLRKRSKRTEAIYSGPNGRRAVVAKVLSERVWCQIRVACKGDRAVDCHEMLPRSAGGSILDETNILAVCRRCHDYCHLHPRESKDKGWLI